MKFASNQFLALSMSAGAVIAAIGCGAQAGNFDIQAAPDVPAYSSPEPPPPPPPPAMTQAPDNDYWTGQGSAGGAPGAGGGG
jgi:hypothetical protein